MKFKNRLPSDVKECLKRVIVFGSRARGEVNEESDIDVVAIVNKKTSEIEKKLEDIAYQVMWEHDFKPIISLKVFAESSFNNAIKRGVSFYENVLKEGVSV